MLIRKLISFIVLFAIAVSLLNSTAFGSPSLIAYFFYCMAAGAVGVLVSIDILFTKRPVSVGLPLHAIVFLAFCLYIIIHGIVTGIIGLTHYYWMANAIYFVSLLYWVRNARPGTRPSEYNSNARIVLKGVAIIAGIESIIVLLQCVKLFPVPGPYFSCTGTWGNPNVTAMFLALSLFAVIWCKKNLWTKRIWMGTSLFILILLSIIALRCRSAYLAAGIIIVAEFGVTAIKSFFRKTINTSQKGVVIGTLSAIALILVVVVFFKKTDSAANRLSIWNNTISLIAQKPLTGYGFGKFEKEYNYAAALQAYPGNEHINMPYNDFLLLGMEGGLMAPLLWIAFLAAFCSYCYKKQQLILSVVSVVIGFVIIQLTNFGFFAIPALGLFLVFTAFSVNPYLPETEKGSNLWLRRIIALAGFLIALFYLFAISSLMGAFYEGWMISKNPQDINSIRAYKKLKSQLDQFSTYHENLGDAYHALGQERFALTEYLKALEKTSSPEVFSKSAYSLQRLNSYDSSEYYYKIVQNMEPKRLIPKFALLKLYLQQQDTLKAYLQANLILSTPAKIRSFRTIEIKQYADSIRKTWLPRVQIQPISPIR